jgi:hypothetical protein
MQDRFYIRHERTVTIKMSDSLAKKQEKVKPILEDVIALNENLNDEAKQNLLAFLEYCNAKNISYKWSSTNRWNLKAKGDSIGYIGIGNRAVNDNSWSVLMNQRRFIQHEDFLAKKGLTEMVHNSLFYCKGCNGNSGCVACTALRFENPDTNVINGIQKIIDFILSLPRGTGNRPILDPATDGLSRIDNKKRVSGVTDLEGNSNGNMDSLFNGKCNSYFYAGPYDYMSRGDNHDIVFELDEPAELKMYGLVTGLRHNVPSGWVLYGATSKDGTWTLLDSQTEFPKPVMLYTEKAFNIDIPKAYQYYKITLEGSSFVLSQIHRYTKE